MPLLISFSVPPWPKLTPTTPHLTAYCLVTFAMCLALARPSCPSCTVCAGLKLLNQALVARCHCDVRCDCACTSPNRMMRRSFFARCENHQVALSSQEMGKPQSRRKRHLTHENAHESAHENVHQNGTKVELLCVNPPRRPTKVLARVLTENLTVPMNMYKRCFIVVHQVCFHLFCSTSYSSQKRLHTLTYVFGTNFLKMLHISYIKTLYFWN